MQADFIEVLNEKIAALGLSEDKQKAVADVAFWAMEQVATPRPPIATRESEAADRERCGLVFNASKYMQGLHSPESFLPFLDGWKARADSVS